MTNTLKKLIPLLIILSFSFESMGVSYAGVSVSEDALRPVASKLAGEAPDEARLIKIIKNVQKDARLMLCLDNSKLLSKTLKAHGINAWVMTSRGPRSASLSETGEEIFHFWIETQQYVIDLFPQGLGLGIAWNQVAKHMEDSFVLISKRNPLPMIYALGRHANALELFDMVDDTDVPIESRAPNDSASLTISLEQSIIYQPPQSLPATKSTHTTSRQPINELHKTTLVINQAA